MKISDNDYRTTTARLISEVWSRDVEMAMLKPTITSFGKSKLPKLTRWQRFSYYIKSKPPYSTYRSLGEKLTRKLMDHFDISEGDWY